MGVPLEVINTEGEERVHNYCLHLAAMLKWIRDNRILPTRKKLNEIIEIIKNKKIPV
jgi:hypothetical protein